MGQPQYSIEARSLSIVGGAASHNFWVLRDQNGNAVAELHGLATDRQSGQTLPIGTNAHQHSLRGHQFIHDAEYARNFGARQTNATYISEGQASHTVITGDKTEILERWKAAAKYGVNAMNARDLDYPPLGVAFPINVGDGRNIRVGDNTVNSNSAYNTFGQLMGVTPYVFPGPLQPGVGNHTLNQSTISNLRYQGPVEFRQGMDPNEPQIRVADARTPSDIQSDPRFQEAARALQAPNNVPAVAPERLEQFTANVAVAARQPGLYGAENQTGLDRIAAVAASTNGRDVILSDAPVGQSQIARHVTIPLQTLLDQPMQTASRYLQDTPPPAAITAAQPASGEPAHQIDPQKMPPRTV